MEGAHLSGACFFNANLAGANLSNANLTGAELSWANLEGVNLTGADLAGVEMRETNLHNADLSFCSLERAVLIDANLSNAHLESCSVFGASVWGVDLTGARQINLQINEDRGDGSTLTVDGLEVAQFLYLMLHSPNIRNAIDTIGKKVVLILGRFTPERKAVLDAIRLALRSKNYVPLLFDFECPSTRDTTETITLLARLSRFIIVDLTDPKSVPHELQAVVPHLPSVPVKPIIQASEREYGMFEHFRRYPWVLDVFRYKNQKHLLNSLNTSVLGAVERAVSAKR